ncbi:centromere protein L-like [Tamandua tetradactyla]|uniref:centromere protein L-like n=1 Tax=Tamandua tetradactyla TaxID=48850 RepID=UPI0040544610
MVGKDRLGSPLLHGAPRKVTEKWLEKQFQSASDREGRLRYVGKSWMKKQRNQYGENETSVLSWESTWCNQQQAEGSRPRRSLHSYLCLQLAWEIFPLSPTARSPMGNPEASRLVCLHTDLPANPCDASELTPRQRASSRLKDYFKSAISLQKIIESVRKLTSLVLTLPRRKIPQCSQLQEDIDILKVAFLLQKQWTLYSLIPLSRFSYTNFKEYSRFLSAFISAEKKKEPAVEVGEDFNIKVTFPPLLELKGTHRDLEAFLVQILCHNYLLGVLAYWTELGIFQIE